jgi:hypothetical protein
MPVLLSTVGEYGRERIAEVEAPPQSFAPLVASATARPHDCVVGLGTSHVAPLGFTSEITGSAATLGCYAALPRPPSAKCAGSLFFRSRGSRLKSEPNQDTPRGTRVERWSACCMAPILPNQSSGPECSEPQDHIRSWSDPCHRLAGNDDGIRGRSFGRSCKAEDG